jgi:hypothetical protein
MFDFKSLSKQYFFENKFLDIQFFNEYHSVFQPFSTRVENQIYIICGHFCKTCEQIEIVCEHFILFICGSIKFKLCESILFYLSAAQSNLNCVRAFYFIYLRLNQIKIVCEHFILFICGSIKLKLSESILFYLSAAQSN